MLHHTSSVSCTPYTLQNTLTEPGHVAVTGAGVCYIRVQTSAHIYLRTYTFHTE